MMLKDVNFYSIQTVWSKILWQSLLHYRNLYFCNVRAQLMQSLYCCMFSNSLGKEHMVQYIYQFCGSYILCSFAREFKPLLNCRTKPCICEYIHVINLSRSYYSYHICGRFWTMMMISQAFLPISIYFWSLPEKNDMENDFSMFLRDILKEQDVGCVQYYLQ